MKFNEKLIQLRKKEGLSQEELGYRLNVTRQTVSKWELGQTTPEMDKLIELSKIFNISVDELINEESEPITQTTKIEDQPIGDINNSKKEKNMKFIIIGILVVIIISIVVKLAIALPIFNKVSKEVDNTSNKQQSFFERIFGGIEGIANKIEEKQENSQNNINEEMKTFTEKAKENTETESVLFNFDFNNCNGTQRGMILKTYLDSVITRNKTKERKIAVKYEETETQDTEKIKNMKQKFEDLTEYEVSVDYDEKGFINKIIIENI